MATRVVDLGRTRLQICELGDGVPVLMCHGFPGLGYSFRNQMSAVAEAGFRAVAIDMLGYGGSSTPSEPAQYGYGRITADLIALLDTLGSPHAVLVGHDFGAPAAWNIALRAPQRVAGLVLLSVAFDGNTSSTRPTDRFARSALRHFLHADYFQTQGPADRELGEHSREFLLRLFHALSGVYHYLDVWQSGSAGKGYLDVLPQAPPLPWSWLSAAEFDHYAQVFARTGFTGALNWYRAMDMNWERCRSYAGVPITAPTLFIAGAEDPVVELGAGTSMRLMRQHVPDLRGVHLIPGAGHWVQQERPDQVNALLTDFLTGL